MHNDVIAIHYLYMYVYDCSYPINYLWKNTLETSKNRLPAGSGSQQLQGRNGRATDYYVVT